MTSGGNSFNDCPDIIWGNCAPPKIFVGTAFPSTIPLGRLYHWVQRTTQYGRLKTISYAR